MTARMRYNLFIMANYYHVDLRARVVRYVADGGTQSEASILFSIGKSTVYRWVKQYRETGKLFPKTPERNAYKLDYSEISKYLLNNNDSTLEEIAQHFSTHKSVIFYALKKMGITRKKNHAIRGAGRGKA